MQTSGVTLERPGKRWVKVQTWRRQGSITVPASQSVPLPIISEILSTTIETIITKMAIYAQNQNAFSPTAVTWVLKRGGAPVLAYDKMNDQVGLQNYPDDIPDNPEFPAGEKISIEVTNADAVNPYKVGAILVGEQGYWK